MFCLSPHSSAATGVASASWLLVDNTANAAVQVSVLNPTLTFGVYLEVVWDMGMAGACCIDFFSFLRSCPKSWGFPPWGGPPSCTEDRGRWTQKECDDVETSPDSAAYQGCDLGRPLALRVPRFPPPQQGMRSAASWAVMVDRGFPWTGAWHPGSAGNCSLWLLVHLCAC